MRQYSVMIKPASALCNLRCRYCFYNDIADLRNVRSFGLMQEDTMRDIGKRLEDSLQPGDEITIAFQGGEPTMAGLDYFRRFTETVSTWKPGIAVHYALQTNATMLDDAWCAFLREHAFLVGVSYDMLEDLHDGARVDASGRPTSRTVLDAIARLRRFGVDFNVLCTLTNQLARHLQRVWKKIEQLDLRYVQFTPCLDELGRPGESRYALTPERFAGFYCTLFSFWLDAYRRGQYRSVKFFDDVISRLAFGTCGMCGMDGTCRAQIVVEADGSVYPCDFYCLDTYCIGNLREKTIQELLQAPQVQAFQSRAHTQPALCRTCEFARFCGGFCKRMQREVCCAEEDNFCGYREFLRQNAQALQQIAQAERRFRMGR